MAWTRSARVLAAVVVLLVGPTEAVGVHPAGAAAQRSTAATTSADPAQPIGTNVLVSVRPDGRAPRAGWSNGADTNLDGRYVVFQSTAHGLVPGSGRTRGHPHVYLRDVRRELTTVIDARPDGQLSRGEAHWADPSQSISADGRLVAFSSRAADLVDEPTRRERYNVYLRDVVSGTTVLVSRGYDGAAASGDTWSPDISADGSTIVFASNARNLLERHPPHQVGAIYRYDVATQTTQLVSRTPGGGWPDANSEDPSVSSDGALVAYETWANDIVDGQFPSFSDAVVYDVATQTSTLLSRTDSGAPPNSGSADAAVTSDGRAVFYSSGATNIVDGDVDADRGVSHIFRFDVASGTSSLVSHSPSGGPLHGPSYDPSPTADGSFVAFSSYARNVVGHDRNKAFDVFVLNAATGATIRLSSTRAGRSADGDSAAPAMAADGSAVSYTSSATKLARGIHRHVNRVYSYRLY